MISSKEGVNAASLEAEMKDIASRVKVNTIEEALHFPKYFQIETTRLCNARCPFCPVDVWDKTTKYMSEKLFDKIVDELREYSKWVEFIAVQRAGEPMIDKRIAERVRRLKDIGIRKVSMSTNASLLSEEKSKALIDAGIDEIMFSIDSVQKGTYELTRVGLKYETTMANIKRFFELREKYRPEILVRVRGVSFHDINNKEHREDLAAWEAFWDEYRKPHDRIYMKKAHSWGNQKIWEGHTPMYDWVYHPCVLPWSTMHVTAMGIVPLCPQDYDAKANLGDVNTHSIAEIWRNERWAKVRAQHSNGNRNEISFCQGCRLFDIGNNLENWQQKALYDG